jgi:hypothetical protein
MVYTREQLLKAVRDAGQDGQPFTLGTVREQLGLKSRDKRELKRFRSRFREACNAFGATGIEKLGPNTFRLTAAATAAPAGLARPAAELASRSALIERVGVGPRQPRVRSEARPRAQREAPRPRETSEEVARPRPEGEVVAPDVVRTAAVERPAGSSLEALPVRAGTPTRGFGSRVLSFFGLRGQEQKNSAATALSRLALDLQPNSPKLQYRCVDGNLRVSVTDPDSRRRASNG